MIFKSGNPVGLVMEGRREQDKPAKAKMSDLLDDPNKPGQRSPRQTPKTQREGKPTTTASKQPMKESKPTTRESKQTTFKVMKLPATSVTKVSESCTGKSKACVDISGLEKDFNRLNVAGAKAGSSCPHTVSISDSEKATLVARGSHEKHKQSPSSDKVLSVDKRHCPPLKPQRPSENSCLMGSLAQHEILNKGDPLSYGNQLQSFSDSPLSFEHEMASPLPVLNFDLDLENGEDLTEDHLNVMDELDRMSRESIDSFQSPSNSPCSVSGQVVPHSEQLKPESFINDQNANSFWSLLNMDTDHSLSSPKTADAMSRRESESTGSVDTYYSDSDLTLSPLSEPHISKGADVGPCIPETVCEMENGTYKADPVRPKGRPRKTSKESMTSTTSTKGKSPKAKKATADKKDKAFLASSAKGNGPEATIAVASSATTDSAVSVSQSTKEFRVLPAQCMAALPAPLNGQNMAGNQHCNGFNGQLNNSSNFQGGYRIQPAPPAKVQNTIPATQMMLYNQVNQIPNMANLQQLPGGSHNSISTSKPTTAGANFAVGNGVSTSCQNGGFQNSMVTLPQSTTNFQYVTNQATSMNYVYGVTKSGNPPQANRYAGHIAAQNGGHAVQNQANPFAERANKEVIVYPVKCVSLQNGAANVSAVQNRHLAPNGHMSPSSIAQNTAIQSSGSNRMPQHFTQIQQQRPVINLPYNILH